MLEQFKLCNGDCPIAGNIEGGSISARSPHEKAQLFSEAIPGWKAADTARFWGKVKVGLPNECWEWQGAPNPRRYGVLNIAKWRILAHRLSLMIHTGRFIPSETHVLHGCDNPPCCNPAHLHEGTHADNMREAGERGRMRPRKGRRVFICRHCGSDDFRSNAQGLGREARWRCRPCHAQRERDAKRIKPRNPRRGGCDGLAPTVRGG